jgi:hypothetical protein
MRQSRLPRLLDRLERESRADAMTDAVRKGVRALPLGEGRDLLHGRWRGHPVHPPRARVPVGSRLPAAVLDLCPGRSRGAGHLAGPLRETTVRDGCVRSPRHGSFFRLSDGRNVRGPATAPQPVFEPRITDGHVEIRPRRQDRDGQAPDEVEAGQRRTETGAHGHGS